MKKAVAAAALGLTLLSTNATAGVCELVQSKVGRGTAGASGTVGGIGATLKALTIAAVEHSSGQLIATWGGSYVAGTLGTVGSTVAFFTSPVTLAVAGAAVAAAGGTYVYCNIRDVEKSDAEPKKE